MHVYSIYLKFLVVVQSTEGTSVRDKISYHKIQSTKVVAGNSPQNIHELLHDQGYIVFEGKHLTFRGIKATGCRDTDQHLLTLCTVLGCGN